MAATPQPRAHHMATEDAAQPESEWAHPIEYAEFALLKKLFTACDKDQSKTITKEEMDEVHPPSPHAAHTGQILQVHATTAGSSAQSAILTPHLNKLRAGGKALDLMELLDKDNDGEVSFLGVPRGLTCVARSPSAKSLVASIQVRDLRLPWLISVPQN